MKKILCLIMIAALLLVGCGDSKGSKSTSESAPAEVTKKADISTIKDAMLAADKDFPEMLSVTSENDNAENQFAYVSSESYDKVEEYVFMYASEGTAEEVVVVKLKDQADVAAMKTSIEGHVATRIKQFETYDATQVPMCKEGTVFSNGNYVVLIIAKDVTAVKNAFYSCFE